jgi:hypothetical protein
MMARRALGHKRHGTCESLLLDRVISFGCDASLMVTVTRGGLTAGTCVNLLALGMCIG